ncbi:MAG: (5-formylfuran-3-yl)methyl phosphate synthase [Gammaproteobacteria bacterium]
MTRLLASVTSVEEAGIVLGAGADIIDLKDPARGALGALSLARIQAIVNAVAGQRPVSATVGDLPADPGVLSQAVTATAATGVDFIKVGLFGPEYFQDCLNVLARRAAAGLRLVAVLFADRQSDLDVVAQLAEAGFAGVMLDTADKASGGLRQHLSLPQLRAFVTGAKEWRLLTGLAGSLRIDDIAPLLATDADYLGFRTALCGGQSRTAGINPAAVAAVRDRLPRMGSHDAIGRKSHGNPYAAGMDLA